MENNAFQLSAYHEAGRVVFAYLCGYVCDSMELPGAGTGGGSRLNSGNDVDIVRAVFSGNPLSVPAEHINHSVEVARKLMSIYCAGTCAEIYFQNDGNVPEELEMDIPARDMKYIEKIQTYLQKAIIDHPEDYPMQTMVSVFKKLNDPDTWKAIGLLAAKILESESKTLTRFYIEDTLMVAGIRHRAPASSGFSVGVQEDESKPAARPAFSAAVHEDARVKTAVQETKGVPFNMDNLTPLYIMVRDFLKRIKNDWSEGELDAAIAQLSNIYKKYGE